MEFLIPLGLYFVFQVLIQNTERRRQLALSTGDKARLLDGASGFHLQQFLPVAVLLLALGVVVWLDPSTTIMWIAVILFCTLCAMSVLHGERTMMRKLRELELPADYLQHRGRMSRIQSVLIVVFFAWLALASWMTLKDFNI